MAFHDTHFHLDLFKNPEETVKKIESAGVYTIAVTNSPSVFFYTKKITEGCKYVKAAIGLHPELAYERKHEVDQLIELLGETRYIGEVGLDNSNKLPVNYETQKVIFKRILQACSDKKNKILTIHSRNAAKDVIDMIGSRFWGKIILHWYSGSIKELERALDYGFYFSINYSMTKSSNGRKIINALPQNRILIETDGPFIEYKKAPATPLMSEIIANEICKIKLESNIKITPEDIQTNFKDLLS
ncbi:MAG: TatD family deoxyribonuclease [Bacteroidetes bacterium]|nr:TatD family deoxyribonuclease [Bacteroidota bacterium]